MVKNEFLFDIENAIIEISHVVKNIVDSTVSSDSHIFASLSVDTNLFELSPKVCAYYSVILKLLVKAFGEESKYAFILYPALRCHIETVSLFKLRKEKGKVVLIYIPEMKVEALEIMPVYLLHEAYHVLISQETL